jgi:UDP-GlcNAc:undecaprenyl-phosphate/decaprenyl-phosphate GlcNAc-1-phosphate transferase
MSAVLFSIFTLAVAALTAALLVPGITALAVRWNFLDYPDGSRHRHTQPVPRLGGVAVFAGLLVAVTLSALISPRFADVTPWAAPLNRALVAASAILFLIGLLDDIRGVSPALKLIAQTAAALIVISFGFRIDVVGFVPGSQFELGLFAVPVTILWLVGVSNAFNLIDGLDGLAGGVGVIALIAISASAAALGNSYVPLQSIALAGALIGFLRHNWPPARIFMGDSGSLVVGFLLAFLAIKGSTTTGGVVYGLVPIFAISYLLLDTGIAILRRWLRGAPLSRADDRHIHHQLLALGLSPRRAVSVIFLQSALIALLGLCVTFVPPHMTLAISIIGVAVLLAIFTYGLRWLEYHEFLEAGASFASGVRKARSAIQDRILARDVARMLRDVVTIEEANAIVRGVAQAFRFVHMEILHETTPVVATIRAPDHLGPTWLLEYPICASGGLTETARAEPVLAIWCAVMQNGRPASPERVAQILAPTLAEVVQRALGLPSSLPLSGATPRLRAAGSSQLKRRRVSSDGVTNNAAPQNGVSALTTGTSASAGRRGRPSGEMVRV